MGGILQIPEPAEVVRPDELDAGLPDRTEIRTPEEGDDVTAEQLDHVVHGQYHRPTRCAVPQGSLVCEVHRLLEQSRVSVGLGHSERGILQARADGITERDLLRQRGDGLVRDRSLDLIVGQQQPPHLVLTAGREQSAIDPEQIRAGHDRAGCQERQEPRHHAQAGSHRCILRTCRGPPSGPDLETGDVVGYRDAERADDEAFRVRPQEGTHHDRHRGRQRHEPRAHRPEHGGRREHPEHQASIPAEGSRFAAEAAEHANGTSPRHRSPNAPLGESNSATTAVRPGPNDKAAARRRWRFHNTMAAPTHKAEPTSVERQTSTMSGEISAAKAPLTTNELPHRTTRQTARPARSSGGSRRRCRDRDASMPGEVGSRRSHLDR